MAIIRRGWTYDAEKPIHKVKFLLPENGLEANCFFIYRNKFLGKEIQIPGEIKWGGGIINDEFISFEHRGDIEDYYIGFLGEFILEQLTINEKQQRYWNDGVVSFDKPYDKDRW